jgi:hypothetical protein
VNRREALAAGTALLALRNGSPDTRKTKNVVVVTFDGFRPEELFHGCEESLLSKQGGVANVESTRDRFWRDSPEERRAALLPFFWNVVAKQGQIYGNSSKNSLARVTNKRNFSYPGYNEMFCGAGDDRIDSNDKVPNPNINVLEWLNGKLEFHGRIAAFCCWDVFPFILNRDRSGLRVHAGWEPLAASPASLHERLLDRFLDELPRVWPNSHFDALAFEAGLDHLQVHKPRLLYFGFGETDEFAHEGRYDLYLESAWRADRMLSRLWKELQADRDYRDQTTLVITTDHGRGGLPDGWKNHGASVPGADKIWIAVIGPDTPPLGERASIPDVTQSQIAATIAQFVGEDFRGAFPNAAPPIADTLAAG